MSGFIAFVGADRTLSIDSPGVYMGTDGESLYVQNCQACHMPEGKGAMGAGFYPALAKNPMLSSPGAPAHVILHGLRGMPSFDAEFSDEQIASVVNYVITHFGNEAKESFTPQDINALRPEVRVVYED